MASVNLPKNYRLLQVYKIKENSKINPYTNKSSLKSQVKYGLTFCVLFIGKWELQLNAL